MSAAARGRRAAHCADRMHAQKTGERTGSRPKPPEAGARSASLEPGRAPGYSDHHSCSRPSPKRREANRGGRSKPRFGRLELRGHVAAEIDVVGIERQYGGALSEVELGKVGPDHVRRRGELEEVAFVGQVAD